MTPERPRKGHIALDRQGAPGLITANDPEQTISGDLVWVGVHLTDRFAPMGSRWASQKPKIIGHVDELIKWILER